MGVRLDRFIVAAALACFGAAYAQPSAVTAKSKRIGLLVQGSQASRGHLDQALVEALRAQGYIEGKNLTIERRYADGAGRAQLRVYARELEDLKLDAVVTTCTPSTLSMKEQTSSTPIVMASVADPVGQGLIATLAKPGGNVTGTSSQSEDVLPKMMEYLAVMAPKGAAVAVLSDRRNAIHPRLWDRTRDAAERVGLSATRYEISQTSELDDAIQAAASEGKKALFVLPDHPLFLDQRARIVAAAAKHQLQGFYWASEFVEAGGLMSYGENIATSWQRASTYARRILLGANPGELPVTQPTTFELVINLRTAKALGVTIPQALLLRADRVID